MGTCLQYASYVSKRKYFTTLCTPLLYCIEFDDLLKEWKLKKTYNGFENHRKWSNVTLMIDARYKCVWSVSVVVKLHII